MNIRRRSALTAAAVMSLAAALPMSAFAQKKIVLGFSQIGAESEWRTANTESIKQAAVGSAPAIDRKKGFEEVIKADPRFKIIRSQTGDFTRAKGKEVMEAFLKAEGKKINVLYAHNDDMAIGAIQAIEEAGMKPGKDIVIVSIDAVKGAFEAMIAGKLNVTVECSPLLGPQLMQAVKDLQAGKPLPKRIVTEEGVFPQEVAAREFPKRQY